MVTCQKCSRSAPDGTQNCPQCFSRITQIPPIIEVRNIDYMLGELAVWPGRKLLSSEAAMGIYAEYIRRRGDLMGELDASVKPGLRPAPQIRQQLHKVSSPSQPAESRPVQPTHSSQIHLLDHAPQTPWFAEFLEAHWLKLLAVLAALLIFAGMRQLLGWEWVSRLAVTLIPVLPIGLTSMFYYYGIRVRQRAGSKPDEKPIGGCAYCAVAIVLAAFSVFSINKHWLGFAMSQPQSHLAGVTASTLLAIWTLRKTRDLNFLHLVLGGFGAVLFTALQVLIPWNMWSGSQFLAYGISFNVLALVYILSASVTNRASAIENATVVVATLRLWAHLSASIVLAWLFLPMMGGAALPRETAAMLYAAAVLSILSAQLFRSAGAAYTAGGFLSAASAILIYENLHLEWYAYGFAAILLSVVALGFAYINESVERAKDLDDSLSSAYEQVSSIASGVAGLFVFARAISFATEAASITQADWAQTVTLAGMCAGIYALYAVRHRIPEILYASCAAGGYALVLTTNRLLSSSGLIAHHSFAHDLLPAGLLAVAIAASLRPYDAASKDGPRWSKPFLMTSIGVAIMGLSGAIIDGASTGASPGLWLSLAAYGLLGAVGTGLWLSNESKWISQSFFTTTVAAMFAAIGFGASLVRLGNPWTPELAAGCALCAAAWLLTALSELVQKESFLHLATVPRWFALVVAGCVFPLAASAGNAALLLMCAPFAAAFLLLLTAARSEYTAPLTAASFLALLFGGLRFAMAASNIGPEKEIGGLLTVATFLFGAAAYGIASRKRDGFPMQSLALVCAAIAGFAGWAFGGHASTLEYATSILAVSGLFAAASASMLEAFRSENETFGYIAAVYFLGSWMQAAIKIVGLQPVWWSAALLPALIILFAAGALITRKSQRIGKLICDLALGASGLGVAMAIVGGVEHPARNSWPITGTLCAYAASYLVGAAIYRAAVWSGLCATTMTIAIGYRLATIQLPETRWALWIALAGTIWLTVARILEKKEGLTQLAPPVYALSAVVSMVSAVVALVFVNEPHQGMDAILALAIVGSTYAGHFALGRGDGFAHLGFGSYFAAYSLFLYDKVHVHANVLDFYLIPAAIYLLVVGHIASKRGSQDTASGLWWIGLMVALSPTYIAFYNNYTSGGTPVHSALLLAECFIAIAWGIARRIKAFVFCGSFFALAYVCTLMAGLVMEIWSGLFAVTLGVFLLSFVFYVSIHHEALLRWMGKMGDGWRLWR